MSPRTRDSVTLSLYCQPQNEGSLELLRLVMFREGLMYSNPVKNRVVFLVSEPELATRADDNGEEGGDAASLISSREWSETMQNLITTLSPSPTSTRGGYAIRGWELGINLHARISPIIIYTRRSFLGKNIILLRASCFEVNIEDSWSWSGSVCWECEVFGLGVGQCVWSARSTITCEKFEVLCGDLFEISLIPLKEVLKHSGLKVDEVELIGYATSVPKLQLYVLADAVSPIPSPHFIRSILHDITASTRKHPNLILIAGIDLLLAGVSSEKFAQFAMPGLTDASEKYSSRNLTSPIKANLHFFLSRSGILSLDRADVVIEVFKVSIELNHLRRLGNFLPGRNANPLLSSLTRCKIGCILMAKMLLRPSFKNVDPIFFRLNELTTRLAAFEDACGYLGKLQQVLSDADKVKDWLEDKEAEHKKKSSSALSSKNHRRRFNRKIIVGSLALSFENIKMLKFTTNKDHEKQDQS
ncbi:hypothetical protein HHK36_031688 [Tetracentron sinense]|uniref:Uncharacterized protein n=1 Tax=Tetracentron sinense TaxID=13715 RepID=A0A835CYC0_TETSI|nr:hypothetical protein HHK36_031688 [Tetracentron sinense]